MIESGYASLSVLLNMDQVSTLLGVHKETLRRWDRQGKLKSIVINDRGDRRYHPQDIKSYLEKNNDK